MKLAAASSDNNELTAFVKAKKYFRYQNVVGSLCFFITKKKKVKFINRVSSGRRRHKTKAMSKMRVNWARLPTTLYCTTKKKKKTIFDMRNVYTRARCTHLFAIFLLIHYRSVTVR